jgi:hypothetical protein
MVALLDAEALPDHPQDGYETIRSQATHLAGAPGDIARRVMVHHGLYVDSGGNHTFPLVALHGALWAAGFFETSGRLGDALRVRYFYDSTERAARMVMLSAFAEGFKAVNRQVFIDTFTNYYYTKHYGAHSEVSGAIHPDLFAALNEMHEARRLGMTLAPELKRALFVQALQHEQEVTVAPGVRDELAKFDCPILRFLCLRPVVRFSYFPRHAYMVFRNFSDTEERIAKAVRSYDYAARAGWPAVEASLRSSRLLPAAYWQDSQRYLASLLVATETGAVSEQH